MANTQALTNVFKVDVLNGLHCLGPAAGVVRVSTSDTFKAALYLATATINAATTVYTSSGEVANSGSYSAGGEAVTWIAPAQNNPTGTTNGSSTAYSTLNASITVTTFSAAAFDAVLIYNDTFATKRAVSVHTFGSQTIVAGTFTLTMPTNDQNNGLVRIT